MDKQTYNEIAVIFCRRYIPDLPEQDCIDSYNIYRSYIDEGQTSIVARQYAGLLTATDIGEY